MSQRGIHDPLCDRKAGVGTGLDATLINGEAHHAAPYFLQRGRTRSSTSVSPFTELTMGLPL